MNTTIRHWLRTRVGNPAWWRRAAKDKDTWKTASLVLLAISAIVTLTIVIPTTLRTKTDAAAGRRASEAVSRGNDAAACRGAFAGAVTDAKTRLDATTAALAETSSNLDVAQAAQQQAFVDLGIAALERSDPAYLTATASIDDATRLVAAVQRQVVTARHHVTAARRVIVAANDDYQTLLDAPPVVFNVLCQAGPGS